MPPSTPKTYFDHERLTVYKRSIDLVTWTTELLADVPKSLSAWDQLDRASTSIPLNIAEGTGKFTVRDKCKYYDSARGSALECAACLDVLVSKRVITPERAIPGKELLGPIVAMLVGLINSRAPTRVGEEETEYRAEGESVSLSSSVRKV